eukprot:TRINITY_DN3117_c0_g1_i1.p1 TRINITY_DN3117_c0_g1~~TRINITY_DN3117_c0_g1_i1.p1  ORF type:complete len:1135 (+),score=197.28 TRINITY_DN3117_c0_g1_i1:48-3452(+)
MRRSRSTGDIRPVAFTEQEMERLRGERDRCVQFSQALLHRLAEMKTQHQEAQNHQFDRLLQLEVHRLELEDKLESDHGVQRDRAETASLHEDLDETVHQIHMLREKLEESGSDWRCQFQQAVDAEKRRQQNVADLLSASVAVGDSTVVQTPDVSEIHEEQQSASLIEPSNSGADHFGALDSVSVRIPIDTSITTETVPPCNSSSPTITAPRMSPPQLRSHNPICVTPEKKSCGESARSPSPRSMALAQRLKAEEEREAERQRIDREEAAELTWRRSLILEKLARHRQQQEQLRKELEEVREAQLDALRRREEARSAELAEVIAARDNASRSVVQYSEMTQQLLQRRAARLNERVADQTLSISAERRRLSSEEKIERLQLVQEESDARHCHFGDACWQRPNERREICHKLREVQGVALAVLAEANAELERLVERKLERALQEHREEAEALSRDKRIYIHKHQLQQLNARQMQLEAERSADKEREESLRAEAAVDPRLEGSTELEEELTSLEQWFSVRRALRDQERVQARLVTASLVLEEHAGELQQPTEPPVIPCPAPLTPVKDVLQSPFSQPQSVVLSPVHIPDTSPKPPEKAQISFSCDGEELSPWALEQSPERTLPDENGFGTPAATPMGKQSKEQEKETQTVPRSPQNRNRSASVRQRQGPTSPPGTSAVRHSSAPVPTTPQRKLAPSNPIVPPLQLRGLTSPTRTTRSPQPKAPQRESPTSPPATERVRPNSQPRDASPRRSLSARGPLQSSCVSSANSSRTASVLIAPLRPPARTPRKPPVVPCQATPCRPKRSKPEATSVPPTQTPQPAPHMTVLPMCYPQVVPPSTRGLSPRLPSLEPPTHSTQNVASTPAGAAPPLAAGFECSISDMFPASLSPSYSARSASPAGESTPGYLSPEHETGSSPNAVLQVEDISALEASVSRPQHAGGEREKPRRTRGGGGQRCTSSELKRQLQHAMAQAFTPSDPASEFVLMINSRLRSCDAGINALRSEVMVCNHMMGVTIAKIRMSKDKEKVFKNAHAHLKMVILDLLGSHSKELKVGCEWPLTDPFIVRIPFHQRASVIRSLQELIIAYDMMPSIKRSTMPTVLEVLHNTQWLVKMAQFCYSSGKVPLSSTPKTARQFAVTPDR